MGIGEDLPAFVIQADRGLDGVVAMVHEGRGEHRSHKGLKNRAENSHQPTRQRERAMKRFRSIGGAQRFLSTFSGISPHFRPRRHVMTATQHRAVMTIRFIVWE